MPSTSRNRRNKAKAGERRYLPEGAFYDESAGGLVCDLVSLLPTSNGEGLLKLQPWQTEAITDFYGALTYDEVGRKIRQYQYLYLELPKKNGKSELSAALGLYHLMWDGEMSGEVYVVAADRDNASIVFNVAVYMIRNTPSLARLEKKGVIKIIESQRTIKHKPTNSIMRVLSAEAYSKHGYKPSCVIFDELHAQPNRDLWDVLTFGAGSARRQPVWIVLTTAGDDPDRTSIGWEIHERALNYLRARGLAPCPLEEDGTPRHYEDDPTWLPIMYGISAITGDDEETIAALDIYDEALWYRCNPSLGKTVSLREVRKEARAAKQNEALERLFRWLRLNQWIATKTVGWIPLTIYDKTQWGPSKMAERAAWLEKLKGLRCYGGLDLSSTTDLTALVLIFPPQKWLDCWVMVPMAWMPTDDIQGREARDHVPFRDWIRAGFLEGCDGDMIDFPAVEAAVLDAMRTYKLELLGMDPYLGRTIAARLAAQGVPVAEIPQGIKFISPPTKELERLIRGHEMKHIHNTCARWTFGNVRCIVDDNENIKPTKKRSIGRIDITMAWIIAFAAFMVAAATPPTVADQIKSGKFSM